VRTIAGQQLSVLAARAIWTKLLAHFDGRVPTPQEILDQDPETLRAAAGFSRAKVVYLRSLAEHVLAGELELHRPDVLAVGDLGVRNAAMRAYDLPAPPKPAELEALAEPWRPHRTRACLYLWRSLENTPD
jgi:DNA-3-methyladenine glycosylase II